MAYDKYRTVLLPAQNTSIKVVNAQSDTMTTDELYTGRWVDYYDKSSSPEDYLKGFMIIQNAIGAYNHHAKKILEIGCGTGNYTRLFAQLPFKIKAIDISKDMLERARQKINTPSATFEQASMTSLCEPDQYDVVLSLFETFRYHESYDQLNHTLSHLYKSLKPRGLFICDFHHFPPKSNEVEAFINKVDMGDGISIKQRQYIHTKGDLDYRRDIMIVSQNGREEETPIERAPLLRISEQQMRESLKKAGFEVKEVQRGFRSGAYESMLFIAQKR